MPVEPIITILIAIVVFALQAYSNFRKEQEKARKRNLGTPPPPLPEENAQRPQAAGSKIPPGRRAGRDRQPAAPDLRPSAPEERVPAFDEYSGVIDVEEVRNARNARGRRQTHRRVSIEEEPAAPPQGSEESVFDLRDAVIKSAILERPYQ